MSKDICSDGLRIGAFISKENPELHEAMRIIDVCLVVLSSRLGLVEHPIRRTFLAGIPHQTHGSAHGSVQSVHINIAQDGLPYLAANSGPLPLDYLSVSLRRKTIESERDLAWRMVKAGM